MITATNECNMELMKRYPDNYFDLAIVDPPYGIGIGNQKKSSSPQKGNGNRNRKKWVSDWDNEIPSPEYFKQLFRVSKNQIIWGGNYFIDYLKNTRCVLIWDKVQEFSGSDFEMAWTSFDSKAKAFRYARCLVHHYPDGEDKIHPTQKPVHLYSWLLQNYAKEGDKILDTHRGSASLDIACHNLGFDLWTCELDIDYFNDGNKRLKNHQSQVRMF